MDKEALENHYKYEERRAMYKSLGYDIEQERGFILNKALPLQGRIAEAGTGKGHFALVLAKAGYRFTSFDISSEEQKFARLNLRYYGVENLVDFRVENAERLSFGNGSFDVVFCVNTVHHLASAYAVIDEFIRILASPGKLVIADFTAEGMALMGKIHASEGSSHEAGPVSLGEVTRYLETKGFKTGRHSSVFQEVIIARKEAAYNKG